MLFLQARIWAASIGFSLLFGPMLAKAVRVYLAVTQSEKDLKQRVSSTFQLHNYIVTYVAKLCMYIDAKHIFGLENSRLAADAICGSAGVGGHCSAVDCYSS